MNRKTAFRIRKTALAVLAALAMSALPAALADTGAEIADDVTNWLREHGASVVDTNAQHYNTSGRGIYTGGSISMRVPNYYVTPITVSAPDIKVGCGGVDLYFGSFSYLKKEELERFARQVMANAPYFAFKVALSEYAPKLNSILGELQSMAQLLSSTQLDACSTSEYLVTSIQDFYTQDQIDEKTGKKRAPLKRSIRNTMDAINAGFDKKEFPAERADGTTEFVNQIFATAGVFKATMKDKAEEGSDIQISVPNADGSVTETNVNVSYDMPNDLKKVLTANNVCGKAEGAEDPIDKNSKGLSKLSQDTITCKIQSGEEGNQIWLNQEIWMKPLMAHVIAARKQKNVISIMNSLVNTQDELMSFVYSTMGFYSQYPTQCDDGDKSEAITHPRTLTLTALLEGGEYRPMLAKDHKCANGAKFYASDPDFRQNKTVKSPVKNFMEEWGNYCQGCREDSKDPDYANENTTIAKLYLNPSMDSGGAMQIPGYNDMAKILGDKVAWAVFQHARDKKPTLAANIAKFCLTAKLLDVYYEQLRDLNQKVLINGVTHNTALSRATQDFLGKSMKEIDAEYKQLRDKYGAPGSTCIKQAGGLDHLVEAK